MISVIIPVYNTYHFLEECINSVKRQTFKDWECIIVDDASTDGSRLKEIELTFGDPRFTVIAKIKNRGLSAARNAGIKEAKGEYLYFLDSDDTIDRNALTHLYVSAMAYPKAGRIFDARMQYWEKFGWSTNLNVGPVGYHEYDEPVLFKDNSCDLGYATGCLYVKKNLPHVLVFPEGVKMFEDLTANIGLLFGGCSVLITNQYHYHYYRHDGSMITLPLTIEEANTIRKVVADYEELYHPKKELRDRCCTFLEKVLRGKLGDNYDSPQNNKLIILE